MRIITTNNNQASPTITAIKSKHCRRSPVTCIHQTSPDSSTVRTNSNRQNHQLQSATTIAYSHSQHQHQAVTTYSLQYHNSRPQPGTTNRQPLPINNIRHYHYQAPIKNHYHQITSRRPPSPIKLPPSDTHHKPTNHQKTLTTSNSINELNYWF
jgi:hypothetical protein